MASKKHLQCNTLACKITRHNPLRLFCELLKISYVKSKVDMSSEVAGQGIIIKYFFVPMLLKYAYYH